MNIKNTYLSAGINHTKRSLDWNKKLNIIAYAVVNRIFIYDPKIFSVVGISCRRHGGSINFVCWAKHDKNSNIILSLSSCGSAILWKYSPTYSKSSEILPILTVGENLGSLSVGYAAFIDDNIDNLLILAASDKHQIIGWTADVSKGVFHKICINDLPKRGLALDITALPLSLVVGSRCHPVIAYGGDDAKVHLLSSTDGTQYKECQVLEGHQDWVTSLAYTEDEFNTIFLASGAKDGFIRLWKLFLKESAGGQSDEYIRVRSIEINIPICGEKNYDEQNAKKYAPICCELESVLYGHSGIVTHIDWYKGEELKLVSCSRTEDKSIIVWESCNKSLDNELWVEVGRLGEVGGNREGFFNVKFGSSHRQIAATSFQGGLHLWNLQDGTSWKPQPVVSGHFDQVVDLDWSSDGLYLLTTSKDQTTRLHAPCQLEGGSIHWQEIARPQVHGYNMSCIVHLNNYKFASGAEEKVIRAFMPTKAFVRNLRHLSKTEPSMKLEEIELATTASVPSLGLSNKADYHSQENNDEQTTDNYLGAPTEDKLMMGTLWPEVAKLYGHGNEILSLASSSDGLLLASSCRATNNIDAKIILWDTVQWMEIQGLNFHRLSVTQMAFSSTDQYLLSVSRDRAWAIFKRDGIFFSHKFDSEKLPKSAQHSRIIWSCCWIPKTLKFITGSRDKSIIIWKPVEECESVVGWELEKMLKEEDEVTAVDAFTLPDTDKILVAIGCNSGKLFIRMYSNGEGDFIESQEASMSHGSAIRRLKFNPFLRSNNSILLASCGNDNITFIYEIHVH